MSIFLLELLRGSDEKACGSVCTGASRHPLHKCQNWDRCYYFVYFVGDGSGAREVKRLAKVTQLDSGYPWMGSPKADPQVRIS